METQAKKRKFHKLLFIKTCFWFAAIMILFAVVLGFVYMRLYEKTIMENYENSLRQRLKPWRSVAPDFFW